MRLLIFLHGTAIMPPAPSAEREERVAQVRAATDAFVLQKYGFPPGRVLAREGGESYCEWRDVLPDVPIECAFPIRGRRAR